jgi:quinol monooxygenase YgiN
VSVLPPGAASSLPPVIVAWLNEPTENGKSMIYVLIRHRVANYAAWKRGVNAAVELRKTAGETSFHAYRGSRSPNDITVVCGWKDMAACKKFVNSAELRKAMKACGVTSQPDVQFFGEMDDLTIKG